MNRTLEEKQEAIRVQAEIEDSVVVSNFRLETERLFRNLGDKSASDIEDIVRIFVEQKIYDYDLNIGIIDVIVSGSRCRGFENITSDIDVVVEYEGIYREYEIFNILHEDSLKIDGIKVDINPINAAETGTLKEYLPSVEKYLLEKKIEKNVGTLFTKIEKTVASTGYAALSGELEGSVTKLLPQRHRVR